MSIVRALTVLVSCLALLLAGCSPDEDATTRSGGDSEFEQAFVGALEDSAEAAADEVGDPPAASASTEERLDFAADYAAALLPRMADAVAEVEAPDDVAQAHAQYVAALRDLSRPQTLEDLLELSGATFEDSLEGEESDSRESAERFGERLAKRPEVQDAFARMAEARAAFAEAGYDLGDVTALPGVTVGGGAAGGDAAG